jgi:hypothetical protein
MNPIVFAEQTTILAEHQPEYRPLPVCVAEDGEVISCWRFTWRERFRLLFGGKLWLRQLTFGSPLQPQLPQVEDPFVPVEPEATNTEPT